MFKVRQVGPSTHPRYVIRNNESQGIEKFWTGKKWSSKVSDALLYYCPDSLKEALDWLTKRKLSKMYPKRRFVMPLEITVFGHPSIQSEQIIDFIKNALTLQMDYNNQGSGPTEDSVVMVRLSLDHIKEINRKF